MSEDVVAQLAGTAPGRRALSGHSPVFFDTYYCGMRWAAHRERWLSLFEEMQTEASMTRQKGHLLLLAPRDHGKTEALITYTARAICQNRDVRILWISASAGQAEKRMRRVKALLESDEIKADWCSDPGAGFRPWRETDEQKWGATQVYVARTLQSVDPTIEAVGSGGAVTGGHFDIILCDDLEDDRTTYTAGQRSKTREWFNGTVRPMLVPGGVMITVGTRKHHDDLYGHMLQDAGFRVIEDKAISQWPDSHHFDMVRDEHGRQRIKNVVIEGDGAVLWEAERPLDYLLRERNSIGQRLFSREFQNEVQDDSAAAVKWAWIEHAMALGSGLSLYQAPEGVQGLDVVQGWDLALVTDAKAAETRDTDYTVGITWGKDSNGTRYLLGICRKRGMSPAQLNAVVVQEYNRFVQLGLRPRAVAVEKNNFGELHFLGLQRTTDLPLKAHITTGKNKADPWDGVPSLSVLFENGKVVLPSAGERDREIIEPLTRELWGLGRETHDDTVMALWITETVLRKSSFVHQVSFGDDESQNMAAEADERMMSADHLDGPALRKQYEDEAMGDATARAWDMPWLKR
jgi:phage terminase large subunit-like protein